MIKVKEISWKNFRAYGNDIHNIQLGEGELILLCGPNGAGKSVNKNTQIRITTESENFDKLKNRLEELRNSKKYK
jgi:predicted ATP-binding protein involved in virulence